MLNLISAVGSAACGINSLAWDASGRKEVNPDFIRKSSHPDKVVVGRKLILIFQEVFSPRQCCGRKEVNPDFIRKSSHPDKDFSRIFFEVISQKNNLFFSLFDYNQNSKILKDKIDFLLGEVHNIYNFQPFNKQVLYWSDKRY
ncbi:MAG: hypothetical protein PHT69_11965 [Bacteroidales bacterium]|nr:hypothetical protein [Bacteroidales bacterium]